jgi:transposase
MKKKYIVTLTEEERRFLREMASRGKAAARKLMHARILLKADAAPGGPGWEDSAIAQGLEVGRATVERVRKEFVEEGLEMALGRRKPRRQYERVLDGDGEAHLIALACQKPPEGRSRWTLRLLADRMVALEYVPAVSYESVHRVLKKTNLSLGGARRGAFRRRPTPSSSGRWRTCWRSTSGPTTPCVRWCAWMKRASN